MGSRSEFVDITPPLRDRIKLYDGTRAPTDQPKNDAADPAKAVPQSFIDAMIVREEVYVQEQKCPLEEEFDEDDGRSYHWVAYASIPVKDSSSNNNATSSSSSSAPSPANPESSDTNTNNPMRRKQSSTSTKIPIGTIRIVPPPHGPHPGNNAYGTAVHDEKEPYVKIGRLAVIKEFRKAGISRLLIETAFAYIRDHALELMPHADPSKMEALTQGLHDAAAYDFRGLVLAHSQKGVQKVWAKYGFVTDESMGEWDEVGIQHVGMWKRLDVSQARRKSRVTLN